MADLSGSVNIDTSGAQSNLNKLSQTAQKLIKTLGEMNEVATSKDVKTIGKKRAEDLTATLNVYSKISAAAKGYASSLKSLSDAEQAAAKGGNTLAKAMQDAAKALSEVKTVEKGQAEALERTLGVYEKQAKVAATMAKADLDAARAKQVLAKAEAEAAKAANVKAGKSAPMTDYQKATLEMKQQAQAAQAAQKAQQQAQQQAQQTAKTTSQNANQQAAAAAKLQQAQFSSAQAADKAAQKQAAAQARLEESQRRLSASSGQNSAKFIADQEKKIAALKTEYSAAQQMVLVYQREADAAAKAAEAARQAANATMQAANNPAGTTNRAGAAGTAAAQVAVNKSAASAAQASAAASAKAATANNNLAASQNRATIAGNNLASTQNKLNTALEREAKAASASENAYANLTSTRYALYEVSGHLTAATIGLSAALIGSVKVAADYESSFADVARTTQLTGTALDDMKQNLVGMTTELPIGFDEVSRIASLGAQLGISNDQVLAFTDTIAKFATVSNVSADDATMAFGRLSNLLGVPAQEFKNLGSAVAELGVNSAATESEILNVAQGIAASAHAAGIGTTYTLGLSTALASLRVPPEMARGAVQRILFIISKAMSEGDKAANAFGKTLGMTGQQAAALFKSDPEAFFSQMIDGIGKATDAGGDYVQILTDLGIKNARDIQVVQRLAGSYDLLDQSINQAAISYADGTFIDTAMGPKLDTLSAKLEMMWSSVKAVADSVGSIFLPALKWAAEAIEFLMNKLNEFVHNPVGRFIAILVVSFSSLLAVMTALKAGLAIAGAGIAAFRQLMASGFAKSTLSVSGLKRELTLLVEEMAASRLASSTVVAGNNAIAASANNAAGALGRQAAAQGAANSAGKGAGAAGAASGAGAAAAGTGGLLSGIGKLALGFGKAIPIIGSVLAIGAPLIDMFMHMGKASDEAAQQVAQYNQVMLDAGQGGASGLAEAIQKDTAAFKESGKAISGLNGINTVYKKTVETAADGSKQWVTYVSRAGGAFQQYGSAVKIAATTTDDYKAKIKLAGEGNAAAKKYIDDTSKALDDQVIALGNNVTAWQENAIKTALTGDAFSDKARSLLVDSGIDLQGLISNAATNNMEAVSKSLQVYVDQATAAYQKASDRIKAIEAERQLIARQRGAIDQNAPDAAAQDKALQDRARALDAEKEALDNQLPSLKENMDEWNHLFGQLTSGDGAIASVIDKMKIVGQSADAAGDGAEGAGEDFEETGDKAITLADALQQAASAFGDVVDAQFKLQDGTAGVYAAMEALGKGLAESTNFDVLSEQGRQNLANVEAVVNAYSTMLQQGIQDGQYSAEQAGSMMQQYMLDLVNQLAAAGVPTPQLDYLVQYANSIANTDWKMTMGADVSGAISGLQAVSDYAALISSTIAAINEQGMPESALSSGYRSGGAASGVSTPVYTGATNFPGAPSAIDLGAINQAKNWQTAANAADSAADAAKDEGSAAKQAGQDAADGADQASEALQKQAEYVKDLASYYEDLGSKAFSLSKAEGDTFAGLADLGDSIAQNGKSFNTFTEGGRSNLEALTGALDAFGGQLSQQIQSGALSAGDAAKQYQQFAGGLRSELVGLGVPMKEVDGFFKGIGASASGWHGASQGVAQYNGVLTAATKYSKEFGEAAKKASDDAAEALERQKQYLSDVADAYANMGANAMSFYTNQAAVFESLQNLGDSIAENGKAFNTVTDAGRKNMSALTDVFSSFGAELAHQVETGVISAKTAGERMHDFAGGIYKELIGLGVKASDISAIFKTIGIDPKGFTGSSAAVHQYAGVLTNAAAAARAAADATSALGAAMEAAKDYADRLGTSLDTAFDRLFGLGIAKDATTSAILNMRDATQQAIDKVKELIAANKQLDADIASAQVDKNKALYGAQIASKYGETGRAADYQAQAKEAQQRIDDAKAQKKANDAEAKATKAGTGQLKGNTKEAIANRASVLDLQKTMFQQIEAYAATGASQKDVIKYTAEMKKQFEAAAKSAGYSTKDLAPYTKAFDTYITAIKKVPKTVSTTVTANTSPAQAALNALPDTKQYTITAKSDTAKAKADLVAIPDKQDYVVTAKASTSAASQALARIPKSGTFSIQPSVSSAYLRNALAHIPKSGDYVVKAKVPSGSSSGSPGNARKTIGNVLKTPFSAVAKVSAAVSRAQFQAAVNSAAGSISTAVSGALHVVSIAASGAITSKSIESGAITARGGGRIPIAVYTGGLITSTGVKRGFAGGGFVPGRAPANPSMDNLTVRGPGGIAMGLRSGEYVSPQPTVQYYGVDFFNALRERTISRAEARMFMSTSRSFAGGGQVGGSGGGSSGNAMMVYLSPDDRALLRAAANRPIDLYSSNDRIATSTARGNRMIAARGGQ